MFKTQKLVFVVLIAFAGSFAKAQVTFYEGEGFRGRMFTSNNAIDNLQRYGFNDRAASAIVEGGRWEVCTDERFGGDCRVLRPGSYDSLRGMGIAKRISSIRPLPRRGDYRYTDAPDPLPQPTYDYRRRPTERLYEARVLSSHAVYDGADQHCWMEREKVSQPRGNVNVPGAIIGGLIGGVLGHQIGNGTGQDIATGVGALGGAAVGANVGGDGSVRRYGQNVEHCSADTRDDRPDYWDVTYDYRGQTHRAQFSEPPGDVVTVNERGEPRG